jgi:hypothetical protein
MVFAASLAVAAIAWAIPFTAPMVWSYWASGLWCAIAIGAIAIHGKRGLWVVLGAPLALWHIAFAAFIYLAWRSAISRTGQSSENYCRSMISGSALSGTRRHCALSSA